jgi:hypothetical protein
VGSDGKTKRFRASIVDLALGSYSPSLLKIVVDTSACQGQFCQRSGICIILYEVSFTGMIHIPVPQSVLVNRAGLRVL